MANSAAPCRPTTSSGWSYNLYAPHEQDFMTCLGAAVNGNANVDSTTADKVRSILAAPDSLRKRIVVRILQRRAASYLHSTGAVGATEAIDWSTVPWNDIIVGLLKILLEILPFIL